MFRVKVTILAVLYLFINKVKCDDILGCGGFIKSHIPIEFSKVEVGLYTKQGTLKDMTDCAPNNGYYFLPLYDQGDYVLRVRAPDGWNFEPTEVSLTVDGETDACSLGRDINFIFVGFAVSGKVISEGSSEGPAGMTVSLHALGAAEPLLQVKTSAGGSYAFPRVAPGQYELRANHPEWTMAHNRASLAVTADSHEVHGVLSVAGYPVSGKVTSDQEAISGVSFVLHAEGGKKKAPPGCQPVQIGLCSAESGADGKFVFPSLTPGAYRIVPYYAMGKEGIAFDVRPKELKFTVGHESLQLTPEFQVKGFTVTGRVRIAVGGAGVGDAKVLLDGQQRALTSQDGSFRLENMQAGTHKLSAEADLMQFQAVEVRVTPSSPQLPDIVPSALSMCGTVAQRPEHLPAGITAGSRTVSAALLPNRSPVVTANTEAGSGQYCMMLAPGDYHIYVHSSDVEIRKGLKFSPPTRQVTVKDKPVYGIDFSPLRATLSGKVVCIDGCVNSAPSVVLVSLDSPEVAPVRQPVNTADGKYSFSDVLPGQYEIRVSSEQPLCWQQDARQVTVASAQSNAPDLLQTGYSMALHTSHATKINYFDMDNKRIGTLDVPRGPSSWCVPGPGPYKLIPESCHEFTPPSITWELSKGSVSLVASKHLVGGAVHSSENHGDITIVGTKEDGSKFTLGPLKSKFIAAGDLEYRFELMSPPGEHLTLEAKAEKLIFLPASATITTGSDCQSNAVVFKGEKGHFVEGKVNPPLEDVEITVTQKDQVISVLRTDKQGRYRMGPLPTPSPGMEYSVSAQREGYQVSQKISGVFELRKLAEVVVRVHDSADKAALPGVLLSLSGGEYRRNSQAGQDGTLTFHSLWPGDYFLRPKLKEYRFEPQSKMITVAEGATVHVDVSGKRVAFSCLGAVTSLSGEPEAGVTLEAVGQGDACKAQQEEAVTESNGQFRIRGLLPKCEYIVRMKEGVESNSHIARISPTNLKVQASEGDVKGVRVIAMRAPQHCDVAVHVVTTTPGAPLRLRLFREEEPDSPIMERKLEPPTMPQHYQILPPLPNDGKAYFIQVDPAPGSTQRKDSDSQIVHFSANSSFRYIRVDLGVIVTSPGQSDQQKLQEDDEGTSQPSLMLLPVLAILTVAIMNRDKLLPLGSAVATTVRQILASAPSVPTPAPAPTLHDEELIVEPVPKRKTKPRKA